MPIYEYKCTDCGNQLEAMQKISDEPLRECPRCHENKLEKQWSLSGFQFKGSGWYISDYTNRGKEAKTEGSSTTEKATEKTSTNDGSAKTSSNTSSESTTDTSTASKPEKKAA